MLREKANKQDNVIRFLYFDQNLQISYYCQTFLFTQHVKHTLFDNIMLTILIQCLTKVTTEQPLEKRHTTLFIHNFLHSNKRLPKKTLQKFYSRTTLCDLDSVIMMLYIVLNYCDLKLGMHLMGGRCLCACVVCEM